MKVTTEQLPAREVLLNIELETEDLEPYLERAYRRVVQRVNVPGFRKGKAPRRIVEQLVGRDSLLSEAIDSLVPEVTNRAVEEQALEVGGMPKVEVAQLDPVVLKATVPLAPIVDLGVYRELRMLEETVEVAEEHVRATLEQLRHDLAPWEPADRPVQFGDLVNLSVQGWADGRQMLDSKGADYIPQEGSGRPVPGFAEAIQGVGAGETKEFTIDLPSDYGDKALAGKGCRFRVTVAEIKTKRLADLDDEFARGVGQGYESLEALQSDIRDGLVRDREREARRQYEEKVLQAVIEGTTVEMSPLLVEEEIDHLLREQEKALKQQRLSMEQYLQTVGKTPEQLRQEVRPAAEARVKRSLVVDKVGQEEDIQVTDEEVQQEIDSLAQGSAQQELAVRRVFESGDGRESLRRMLTSQKAVRRLADIARGSADGATPEAEEEKEAGSPDLPPEGEVGNGGSENG